MIGRRAVAIAVVILTIALPQTFLAVANAQTAIQPIKVWTDKSAYNFGDTVTIFWDKNGPCIDLPDAKGTLTISGWELNLPSVSQSQLQSGSVKQVYDPQPFDYTPSPNGTYTVSLDILATNCHAVGSTMITVSPGPGSASISSSNTPLIASIALVAIVAVLAGSLLVRRRRSRSKTSTH